VALWLIIRANSTNRHKPSRTLKEYSEPANRRTGEPAIERRCESRKNQSLPAMRYRRIRIRINARHFAITLSSSRTHVSIFPH